MNATKSSPVNLTIAIRVVTQIIELRIAQLVRRMEEGVVVTHVSPNNIMDFPAQDAAQFILNKNPEKVN